MCIRSPAYEHSIRVYKKFHIRDALAIYTQSLERCRYLFNILGPREDIQEHIADCLLPVSYFFDVCNTIRASFPQDSAGDTTESEILRCVDLGTGAGLPGVLLSLVFYEQCAFPYEWVLLERKQKKAQFVQDAISAMQGVLHKPLCTHVACADLAQWMPKSTIHIITARAFHPLTKRMLRIIKKIAPQAVLMLYKGMRETIDRELQEVGAMLVVDDIIPLVHPLKKQRHILIARFA